MNQAIEYTTSSPPINIIGVNIPRDQFLFSAILINLITVIVFCFLFYKVFKKLGLLDKTITNIQNTFIKYLKKLDDKNERLYKENKKLKD